MVTVVKLTIVINVRKNLGWQYAAIESRKTDQVLQRGHWYTDFYRPAL